MKTPVHVCAHAHTLLCYTGLWVSVHVCQLKEGSVVERTGEWPGPSTAIY